MQQLILAFLTLSISIGLFSTSNPTEDQKMHHFSWLEGEWQRSDLKDGTKAIEIWKMNEFNHLIGDGYVIKGVDTTFHENLVIKLAGGEAYYIADIPGNAKPVSFLIVHVDTRGFRAENQAHDFPKVITYKKDGDRMVVNISGDDKSTTLKFTKIKS